MNVKRFEFEFPHQGRKFPAICTIYTTPGETEMPYKYPLYRVVVMTKRINPEVYLFWEVNNENKKFFWYPFAESKEPIGKSIAEALEKI